MAANQDQEMIERNCLICGKMIRVSPSKIDSRKACSLKCLYAWRRIHTTGSGNPAYKGGKVLDTNGYIRIRGTRCRRGCYEHQQVMEQYLGRTLRDGEEVHHINGIKDDNRLQNLYVVDKKSHTRKHFELFVRVQRLEWENRWLREEIKKYEQHGPQVIRNFVVKSRGAIVPTLRQPQ